VTIEIAQIVEWNRKRLDDERLADRVWKQNLNLDKPLSILEMARYLRIAGADGDDIEAICFMFLNYVANGRYRHFREEPQGGPGV
jgi:hypothetical protein